MIASGAKAISEVSSSDVWNALASNKTVTHGLAGGGLGMVANAGYNYAEDDRGGYLGSAMAGAGASIAGSVAWRSGGKKLAHTASDKVKQSVATRGGTEDFSIRTYAGNQHLVTDKAGNFDEVGQKTFADKLEKQLKNTDAGSSNYDSLLRQYEEAKNGLDHMQSVKDHRLSQTEDGAQKLLDKFTNSIKMMDNSAEGRLYKQYQNLSGKDTKLKEGQADLRKRLNSANSAIGTFKKGGGDINSAEGQDLIKPQQAAQALFNNHGANYAKFKVNHGKTLADVSSKMDTDKMRNFVANRDAVSSKQKAASSLLQSFSSPSTNPTRVRDSVNRML